MPQDDHLPPSASPIRVPSWLDAPLTGPEDLIARDTGLDPFRRIGRHVMCVVVQGTPLAHADWVALHGDCPPGCGRLPVVPPADPDARSPAWDAWERHVRGIGRSVDRARARALAASAAAPTAAAPSPPAAPEDPTQGVLPLALPGGDPYL